MFKQECKKVESMLSAYIENKLSQDDVKFLETHIKNCTVCYNKYLTMKTVMKNLRFEYEKLLNEFEKIEAERIFKIREHENFASNISPYLDDELSYEECIKFRTYLLKSKNARQELSSAYSLKNNIQNTIAELKNDVNLNFEKSIIKQLKAEEVQNKKSPYYKRASILISTMVSILFLMLAIFSYSYLTETQAYNEDIEIMPAIEFPDENFVEYNFDDEQNALLTGNQ